MLRPKSDQVKQESDKMDEIQCCAIVVIFDFRNLADVGMSALILC